MDMTKIIAQAKAMSQDPNAPPRGIFPECHGENCDYSVGDGTVAYATWYKMLKKLNKATDSEYAMWKMLKPKYDSVFSL
jgi:hypothetical protein